MNPPGTPSPAMPSVDKPPKSPKKKEFIFDTLGKLTRPPSVKKERKMAEVLNQESLRVRDSPSADGRNAGDQFQARDYHLEEGEQRTYIDPASQETKALELKQESAADEQPIIGTIEAAKPTKIWRFQVPEVQELMSSITNWINDELGESTMRIKIKDLETDLFDGLVLKVLVEKLSGQAIPMPAGEFVQSEERQRINLKAVLNKIEEILEIPEEQKAWDVRSIFEKNLLSTLRLLLIIINRYSEEAKVLIDLPKSLKIKIIKVMRTDSRTNVQTSTENLISGFLTTRDGFDTLIDHAPEKLHYVKKSLLQFANIHLGQQLF